MVRRQNTTVPRRNVWTHPLYGALRMVSLCGALGVEDLKALRLGALGSAGLRSRGRLVSRDSS